ncbi:hypothetical protein [Alkalihalobacillus sp. 1P02AB]|uniref:hypothetical protein n=1 Tax=Alkalihalobacillus sp. 1P02AB TaxID=3132260 RepID=UPI0039A6E88F
MKRIATIPIVLFLSLSMSLFLLFYFQDPKPKETLTYFPPDPNTRYIEIRTELDLSSVKNEKEYVLTWETHSMLDQKSYLRQDVSLLFEDGFLKDVLSTWKENTEAILQTKEVTGEESGRYQAITFHYAELHQGNDSIKSAQALSHDELYVIDSPLSKIYAFKEPQTLEEKESKRTIDYIITQKQHYDRQELLKYFNLNPENYIAIPLTDLPLYLEEGFPGIPKEKTTDFLGGLWEGLYKEYVLNIQKPDGTEIKTTRDNGWFALRLKAFVTDQTLKGY